MTDELKPVTPQAPGDEEMQRAPQVPTSLEAQLAPRAPAAPEAPTEFQPEAQAALQGQTHPEDQADLRQSRTADSRAQDVSRAQVEAPKVWTPPRQMETPPAPPGWHFRWVRASLIGEDDRTNMYNRQREGFQAVKPEDIHTSYHNLIIDEGRHSGLIGRGGLILMKVPAEFVEQRAAHYRNEVRAQSGEEIDKFKGEGKGVMPTKVYENSRKVAFQP